jgi:sugar lactone lactonase YvrE
VAFAGNERFEEVLSGLAWPESPRWHAGALWFSDVHNFRVVRWHSSYGAQVVCSPKGRPAGIGFMPDGRLLVSTALDRKLWWVSASGELSLAFDASAHVRGLINDMIVDDTGRAWFGDTGFDLLKGEPQCPGALMTWADGDADARVAAHDIEFPNGLVMTEDGRTLYLAETFGRCITAFDVEAGGLLSNRRVHARLEDRPDGLCADAEGALWVPLLWRQAVHRIAVDGLVSERFDFRSERVISCVLGGEDRRTLFVGVARMDETDKNAIKRFGSIVRMTVDQAGSGIP